MSAGTTSKTRERFTFTLPPLDPLPDRCLAAEQFMAVWEPALAKVRAAPDELAVNVALLQLQEQYFRRYTLASKSHRDHIGTRNGHTCLFQVYCHYYEALRELLLAVNPPPLRAPAPAAPVHFEIAGVPFGIKK
jgi:hypothetical protein